MAIFGSKVQGAQIAVDVTAETSAAERALTDFSSGLGRVADVAKRAVVGALVGLGTAAAGGLVAAVKAGADLGETLSKVGVVFGEAQGQVIQYANDMAKSFGIPKQAILDAAGGFGLLFKGAGLAADASAGLSTQMSQLAVDASSFYNVPLEEALAAIKSGLVGESEPLRAYGLLLNEAAVQQEAVALGIASAGDKLTEQQKVMARSSLITKGFSDASGDLARTQDSVSNRFRQLVGVAQNMAAEFGSSLQPAVSGLLGKFAEGAGPIQEFADSAGYAVGAVLDMLLNGTQDADDWINGLGLTPDSPLIQGIEMIRAAVSTLFNEVLPVAFSVAKDAAAGFFAVLANPYVQVFLAGITGLIIGLKVYQGIMAVIRVATLAWAAAQAVLNVVMTANPIGIIIVAVLAIGAALVAAYMKFEGFRNVVDAVFAFVKDLFSGFIAWLGPAWDTAWSILGPLVKGYFDTVLTVLNVAWTVVKALFQAGLAVVTTAWKVGWAIFGPILEGVWTIIKTIISTATKIIVGLFVAFIAILKGDWSTAGEALKKIGKAAWDGLVAIIKAVIQTLLGVVKGLTTSIPNALSGLAGKLKSIGSDMIQGLINGIKNMAGNAARAALDVVEGAYNAAKKFLKIGSPSKLWEELGVFDGMGFVKGHAKITGQVKLSGQQLAEAAIPTLPRQRTGAAALAGIATGPGLAFTFNTYNPVAEPTSMTTNRALTRSAALGFVS